MKIQVKLPILLLTVALVPLFFGTTLHYFTMNSLGHQLAEGARNHLTDTAHEQLLRILKDYESLLESKKSALEHALASQVREAELLLATIDPSTPNQAALEKVHRSLRHYQPDMISRQTTVLSSGITITSTASPIQFREPDPRQSSWYLRSTQEKKLNWSIQEQSNDEKMSLVIAAPIFGADGLLGGVTALTVPVAELFHAIEFPAGWSQDANTMLIIPSDRQEHLLRIVAHGAIKQHKTDWTLANGEAFTLDLHKEQEDLTDSIARGESGVRLVYWRGERVHLAYSKNIMGHPLPILTLPHDTVISFALQAEKQIKRRIGESLYSNLITIALVAIFVLLLSVILSRTVTTPLKSLTSEANKLAGGDFAARVDIATNDEFQDLAEMFNQVGPALEEHQTMASSLALAGEIQKRLQPHQAPTLVGFDMYGSTIYCDETGGDYYDFIRLDKVAAAHLGIAVGDVSGHGIPSALLMASARAVLRTHAVCHDGDLSQLFSLLNNHLVRDTSDDQFMTLFYGVLNGAKRTLCWNSAGHGPVLLFRAKGQLVESLSPTGHPLGIMVDATYSPSGPIDLAIGDIVLIATDGLWESRNVNGEAFGLYRLQQAFLAAHEKTADDIHAEILRELKAFLGQTHPEDDITLLVVKATS